MKLTNQPTQMTILRTFNDSKGNQYELRGQKNMYSPEGCFKTSYLELYKKAPRMSEFKKVHAKEEISTASYSGYQPSVIKRAKYNLITGNAMEFSEVFKRLNGYDIECKGTSLSMDRQLRVIHANDQYGKPFTKIKLPDKVHLDGTKPLTPMAKHIIKLLQHV